MVGVRAVDGGSLFPRQDRLVCLLRARKRGAWWDSELTTEGSEVGPGTLLGACPLPQASSSALGGSVWSHSGDQWSKVSRAVQD